MSSAYIDMNTIGALHDYYRYGKPKHPLITVIDLADAHPDRPEGEIFFRTGFYSIICKRFEGILKYGRSHYDFEEGTLMFTSPGQVISSNPGIRNVEGWGLFFHPDLLNRSELGRKIQSYSFFHYDVNEALHLSEDEDKTLQDCLIKIEREYAQNIDRHTQGLIVDNLQLILSYCDRFYDRQFMTRAKVGRDTVQQFEHLLREYFGADSLVEEGLPDVQYFASALGYSSGYLSDLLLKYTGKTTLEHIHLQLIDRAKHLLWSTDKPVSAIAYELGFEHPSHFSKLFKARTGESPRSFRKQE